jgi:acetyltransferase-like isoleucine patch superfamily enzyme
MNRTSTKYRLARRVLLLIARLANRINGFEALNTLFLFVPFQMIPDILRAYGAQIGNDVEILGPIRFGSASRGHGASYHKLSIGEHSKLSRELYLDLTDQITIESNVTFAMRVTLSTHTGLAESPLAALYPFATAPIIVRKGAYVGASVTVLQGVEIGSCAVVAAGAVVTKDVPSRVVCGGVPARVLKTLPEEEVRQ